MGLNPRSADAQFMERALELAWKGYGWVHPNPHVGCVVVKDGRIVGEGFHRSFGGPHAEVHALRAAGARSRGATLYVNLEPCVHHGKTPPCTDAIVQSGIACVVVACSDPNPLVAGQGLRRLRHSGIHVRVGVLRQQAEEVNERFLHFHRTGMPFVGLKWAQTLDGFIADVRGRSRWITSEPSRRMAHVLRGGYDAVLVGAGTVLADDPRLTVRHISARQPVRVVLDGRLLVTGSEKVFNTRNARTILLTQGRFLRRPSSVIRLLMRRGVDILGMEGGAHFSPRDVIKTLGVEGVTSVLVEGGPATAAAFLDTSVWDKAHIFVSATLLGGGTSAAPLAKPRPVAVPLKLHHTAAMPMEHGEMLIEGYRQRP
ncbi:MAG: riboflavin biosynthesis protein RibD [Ignavibacteria bacterium GWC2_56_12]|nr:MAG: riboflavin biosynthesis protein RibD [Ignavibacteria bacterium GWC2_56_12]